MNIKFLVEPAEDEAGNPERNWSRIRLVVDGKPVLAESPVFNRDVNSRIPGFADSCARAIRTNAQEWPGIGGWTSKLGNIDRVLDALYSVAIGYRKPIIEYTREA